jgi:hypothetical protein
VGTKLSGLVEGDLLSSTLSGREEKGRQKHRGQREETHLCDDIHRVMTRVKLLSKRKVLVVEVKLVKVLDQDSHSEAEFMSDRDPGYCPKEGRSIWKQASKGGQDVRVFSRRLARGRP